MSLSLSLSLLSVLLPFSLSLPPSFLSSYLPLSQVSIDLDACASELRVSRERILDILKILESVDVVQRQGKSVYLWVGLEQRMPAALLQLEQAIRSAGNGFQHHAYGDAIDAHVAQRMQHPVSAPELALRQTRKRPHSECASPPACGRRPEPITSLIHLSQMFVQMFLSDDRRIVGLDDAGRWLFGGIVIKPGETEAKATANFKGQPGARIASQLCARARTCACQLRVGGGRLL